MNNDLEFLLEVVKEARTLIDGDLEIKAKGDKGDLVTNFDYEIEKFIIDKIKKTYPDFCIVSEEYNSNKELTENCFTVDPIDGTINFANGIPLWGIQVACIREQKTCAAVIYLPMLDELYYADDKGAFLNGVPIFVNKSNSNLGIYCIEGSGALESLEKMVKINPRHRNFYCAAVDFAWVACGRISATNFRYNTPWDYIPGEYIVEKAGGVVHNSPNMHIAANSEEFLEVLKENC